METAIAELFLWELCFSDCHVDVVNCWLWTGIEINNSDTYYSMLALWVKTTYARHSQALVLAASIPFSWRRNFKHYKNMKSEKFILSLCTVYSKLFQSFVNTNVDVYYCLQHVSENHSISLNWMLMTSKEPSTRYCIFFHVKCMPV